MACNLRAAIYFFLSAILSKGAREVNDFSLPLGIFFENLFPGQTIYFKHLFFSYCHYLFLKWSDINHTVLLAEKNIKKGSSVFFNIFCVEVRYIQGNGIFKNVNK